MTTTELRALLAKATPGPWDVRMGEYVIPKCHAERPIGGATDPIIDRDKYAQHICHVSPNHRHRPDYEQRANRDLIVAAVNALPELLDRVEAAEADAARYRWLRPHFRTFSLDMGGQHLYCIDSNIGRIRGPSIDAAIDAAMKGEA